MDNDSIESQGSEEMVIDDLDEYEEFMREETIVFSRMNGTIFKVTNQLIMEYELCAPRVYVEPIARREVIKRKIERYFVDLVQQIAANREPELRIRDRQSWYNCFYDTKLNLKSFDDCTHRVIKFCARKSLPKFSLIYFVLGKIYKLLTVGETCTKRELYYQNLEYINNQHTLDAILNEISCLLDCPLYQLNIYATSKGLIYGPLKIVTNRDTIDCNVGCLIPNDICNIVELQTDAKFVILIEKDAVFQKLIDTGAMLKLPTCLFVTGKGMPDINTRAMLKTIWDMLHIPILAFVDADPWGIDIMCIYRFGSRALSHQADLLAVPSIRWLGPFPSEISKLCDRTAPLSQLDQEKLSDLLERPYIKANKKIGFEVQYMLTTNLKAEIEDLEFSVGYLNNVYLPHKIALGDFI